MEITVSVGSPIKRHARGRDVALLQALLFSRKLLETVDGDFGPKTRSAVVDFQEMANLDPDGIVGEKTWKALFEAVYGHEGKDLTLQDYEAAAVLLGVDVPTIQAVCEVESSGKGFLEDGRPKVLFEGHVFWKQLIQHGIDPQRYAASHPDIVYPAWTKQHYLGGVKEYSRLERAKQIHWEAANKSASWGMFQIMGFNYQLAGYVHLGDFLDDMNESEGLQLMAFCTFVHNRSLDTFLKVKDWAAFAHGYNGPGYMDNKYVEKFKMAYEKFSRTASDRRFLEGTQLGEAENAD